MPSAIASSTPVTVTVCAAFQFTLVNVSDVGETVPSLASLDDSAIVTLADGWLLSTTVNVAGPPASVVGPLGGETVMPAASLSVFVIDTSAALSPV